MRASTLVKFSITLGSLCLTAWGLPKLIDRVQAQMANAKLGSLGSPNAGGTAALLSALTGQPAPGAPNAPQPAVPSKPDDFQFFSAKGATLPDTERQKMLKNAARLAPKPNSTVVVRKPDKKAAPVRGPGSETPGAAPGSPLLDPTADLTPEQAEQALRDLTNQMNKALEKKPRG